MIAKKLLSTYLLLSLTACGAGAETNTREGEIILPIAGNCYEGWEDAMRHNSFEYLLVDGKYVVEVGEGLSVRKTDQFAENFNKSSIEIEVEGNLSTIRFMDANGKTVEIPLNAEGSNYYYGLDLPDHLKSIEGLDVLHFTMDIYGSSGLSVGGNYNGCTTGNPL